MTSVIAGKYKGQKIMVPKTRMRPSTARLRDCLATILTPHIPNARVLDLFAGSGAVGLELLSRGARSIAFVESHPLAIAAITDTTFRFVSDGSVSINQMSVMSFFQVKTDPFNLIFLDPPYSFSTIALHKIIALLPRILVLDGLVIVETTKQLSLDSDWHLLTERPVGQSRLCIYSRVL